MKKKRHYFGRGWTRNPPPERCLLCEAKLVPVIVTVEAGKYTLGRSNVTADVKVAYAAGRPYLVYTDLAVHLVTAHNKKGDDYSCVCGFAPFAISESFVRTVQAIGEHLQALGDELEAHLLFHNLGKNQ